MTKRASIVALLAMGVVWWQVTPARAQFLGPEPVPLHRPKQPTQSPPSGALMARFERMAEELRQRREYMQGFFDKFYEARAEYQQAANAYLSAAKRKREEFEKSEAFLGAKQHVEDVTKTVREARARMMEKLSKDPGYQDLLRKEAAAQRKVDALRAARATSEEIFAATTAVLRIGGQVSAMVREWEQADATLHDAMQELSNASAVLSKTKNKFEADFAADAELSGLKKTRDDDYVVALAALDEIEKQKDDSYEAGINARAARVWAQSIRGVLPPGTYLINPHDSQPVPAGLPSMTPEGGGTTTVGGDSLTPTGTPMTPTGGASMTPTGGASMTPGGGVPITPVGTPMTPVGGAGLTPVGGGRITPVGGVGMTPVGGGAAPGSK